MPAAVAVAGPAAAAVGGTNDRNLIFGRKAIVRYSIPLAEGCPALMSRKVRVASVVSEDAPDAKRLGVSAEPFNHGGHEKIELLTPTVPR